MNTLCNDDKKKHCLRVLAASMQVIAAMTRNPSYVFSEVIISHAKVALSFFLITQKSYDVCVYPTALFLYRRFIFDNRLTREA